MPNELQFFAILVFAAVFLGVNFGIWRWSNRRRHDGLTLAVEDQTPDDLMAVAEAVQESVWQGQCNYRWFDRDDLCVQNTMYQHRCADDEDHYGQHDCGCGTWILVVEPQPTLGQERLYNAEGLVQYGLELVDRRCLDARRDFATDLICPACAKVFGTVTA